MNPTTISIGKDKYTTKVVSQTGNELIADEPTDKGGQDAGLSPGELMAASLGACSCITMRMYADRKEWAMDSVSITVNYERNDEMRTTHFTKEITIVGDLDEEQRKRLIHISSRCPIHLMLSNPIQIETIEVS